MSEQNDNLLDGKPLIFISTPIEEYVEENEGYITGFVPGEGFQWGHYVKSINSFKSRIDGKTKTITAYLKRLSHA